MTKMRQELQLCQAPIRGLARVIAVVLLGPSVFAQGRFESTESFHTLQLGAKAAVDVDQDGDLDVLGHGGYWTMTSSVARPLMVLVNDGDGRFTDETAARALNRPGFPGGSVM